MGPDETEARPLALESSKPAHQHRLSDWTDTAVHMRIPHSECEPCEPGDSSSPTSWPVAAICMHGSSPSETPSVSVSPTAGILQADPAAWSGT